MKRKAFVEWRGNLLHGEGTLSTESGILSNIPYSYSKRFGETPGTNPEELIGAAHAGCFAMAFSGELSKMSLQVEFIEVIAEVSLEQIGNNWGIPAIHLLVRAQIPGGSYEQTYNAAQVAKLNCPISKLLKANITLDFDLTETHEQTLTS